MRGGDRIDLDLDLERDLDEHSYASTRCYYFNWPRISPPGNVGVCTLT